MLVVEDVLICWMRRVRIVRLHANIVSRDVHVLSGRCEGSEGLVLPLCVAGWQGAGL